MNAREAVYEMWRERGMTTMFGNPGSTELPMFRDFPSDFRYVLGLQESIAVGMADGFAQATRNAALVIGDHDPAQLRVIHDQDIGPAVGSWVAATGGVTAMFTASAVAGLAASLAVGYERRTAAAALIVVAEKDAELLR